MSKPIEYPKISSLTIGERFFGVLNNPEDIVFDDNLVDKLNDGIRVLSDFKEHLYPNLPTLTFSNSYNSVQAEFLDILLSKQKRLPRKLKKAYKQVQSHILYFSIEFLDTGSKIEPKFEYTIKNRLEAKAKRLIIAEYSEYTCHLR